MAKTRTWVILIVVILLLSGAASVFLYAPRSPAGGVARIYVDGELVRSVDLSALSGEERFTVETEGGVNVILAEAGRIRVESADCPDQVCVRRGWLSSSPAPIVCLPHRLVIRLDGGGAAVDTEVG